MRLEFSGPSPVDAQGRPTPFAIDWVDGSNDILFHFNPRPEGHVVLNSRLGGCWGEELVVERYPFSADPRAAFALRFDVDHDCFRVRVDGRELCAFPHRKAPTSIRAVRSTLFLWRLESGIARVPDAQSSWPSATEDWVRAEENPPRSDCLDSFKLFAVLCSWREEDVIAATVANAYEQGCDRVYLVDNGSRDRTVERAVEAGAVLARTFDLGYFDDLEKTRQMQAVVDEVSAAGEDDHVWWLWLDADEFHHGPGSQSLREYLASLDRRFRVVGARFFNHLPTADPAYIETRHPLDYQPLCYEIPDPQCDLGHAKHPLQRWDRGAPRIESGQGFHRAAAATLLLEPTQPVFCHHFPFRAEANTKRRLAGLLASRDGRADRIGSGPDAAHMRLRQRSLDAVYRQRWDKITVFPPCVPGYVPELKLWNEWVPPADRESARWYRRRRAASGAGSTRDA